MRLIFVPFLIASLHAAPNLVPLKAWLARQQKVETLQADFVQRRTLPALKKPVETEGTLIMDAAGRLRWELGQPPRTIALADGETITLIDLKKKEARHIDADSPEARAFSVMSGKRMAGGLDGFLEIFEPIEARTVNGIYQLTTRPRPSRMRNQLRWVFFDIDPARETLRAIEMQLDDRSRIKTIFSNAQVNQPIPASKFQFNFTGYTIR